MSPFARVLCVTCCAVGMSTSAANGQEVKTSASAATKKSATTTIEVSRSEILQVPYAEIVARMKTASVEERQFLTRAIIEGPTENSEDQALRSVELVSVEEGANNTSVLHVRQRIGREWIEMVLNQTLEENESKGICINAAMQNVAPPMLAYSTTIHFAAAESPNQSTITIGRKICLSYSPRSVHALLAKSLFDRQTDRLLQNAEAALSGFCKPILAKDH